MCWNVNNLRNVSICFEINEHHKLYLSLQNEKDVASLDPWLLKEMDACISDIFLNEDHDAFVQLFNLILSENVSGMTLCFSLLHVNLIGLSSVAVTFARCACLFVAGVIGAWSWQISKLVFVKVTLCIRLLMHLLWNWRLWLVHS